jgi:hypothetical protein
VSPVLVNRCIPFAQVFFVDQMEVIFGVGRRPKRRLFQDSTSENVKVLKAVEFEDLTVSKSTTVPVRNPHAGFKLHSI